MTESTSAIPGRSRPWVGIVGEDEADVLDQWNALPAWSIYDPDAFRSKILEFAEVEIRDGGAAPDEEILPAVVAAMPDALKLEQWTTAA